MLLSQNFINIQQITVKIKTKKEKKEKKKERKEKRWQASFDQEEDLIKNDIAAIIPSPLAWNQAR